METKDVTSEQAKEHAPITTSKEISKGNRPLIGSVATRSPKRPLLFRLLFHPMFYIAILVHGGLLAIPGQPEEDVIVEEEVEVEESDTEEITLTLLPAAEPEPIPEPESVPESEPVPAAEPVPQPVQQQVPPPVVPEPEPLPEPGSTPESEPELDPEPEPEPESFDPSGIQSQAASNISNLGSTQAAPLEKSQWSRQHYGQFVMLDANGEPQRTPDPAYMIPAGRPLLREGIVGPITWQNDLRIENIHPGRSITGNPIVPPLPDQPITDSKLYLGSLYSDNMVVTQIGSYGGGPVFQVATLEGDVVEFLNPVPPRIKTAPSFYLVRWRHDPNSPPPTTQTNTNS